MPHIAVLAECAGSGFDIAAWANVVAALVAAAAIVISVLIHRRTLAFESQRDGRRALEEEKQRRRAACASLYGAGYGMILAYRKQKALSDAFYHEEDILTMNPPGSPGHATSKARRDAERAVLDQHNPILHEAIRQVQQSLFLFELTIPEGQRARGYDRLAHELKTLQYIPANNGRWRFEKSLPLRLKYVLLRQSVQIEAGKFDVYVVRP